jgi:predicted ester cyclase
MKKKLTLFVCLMVLATFALSSQQQVEKTMCEKNSKVLLDKELYTFDCVATSSSTPVHFVGHEGIKQWIENSRAMMPDLVMAFPEIVAKPDKIVAVWTMTGTQTGPMVTPGGMMPGTGRKVNITGMSIDYLKDGKLAKEVVIFNTLEMLMQLGFTLNPPVPSAPAAAPVK